MPILMLRKAARYAVTCSLPMAAAFLSSRHTLSPLRSYSAESDANKSFFEFIDKVKWSASSKKSSNSDSPATNERKFDKYTQNILADWKSAENKVRETASLQESSIREALSFHKNKMDELTTTFKTGDFLDIIPASIIDDSTKSSLRDLSAVYENIISQYQRTVATSNHPFLVNLGLLRLYSIEQARQTAESSLVSTCAMKAAARDEAGLDVFLAEVRHFLRHADDVYEDNSMLYLSPSDILVRELEEQSPLEPGAAGGGGGGGALLQHPRYVVFLDHLTQSLVVVIRGTASVSDIITDLHCSTRPFMGGTLHAHAGMATSAEALLSPVLDALEKGRSMKGGAFRKYKVVVTGHSLGAGTAALLSLLLANQFPLEHVTTYAFAPPPILATPENTTPDERDLHDRLRSPSAVLTEMALAALNPSFQDLPTGSPPLPRNLTIHSFVHNEDLIPRCSMHEFMNMLAAADAIDKYPDWSASDRAAMLIRGTLSGEELQQLRIVLTSATSGKELKPSEDHQLVIPGHLYWLLPRRVPPTSNKRGSNAGVMSSGSDDVEAKVKGGHGPGSVPSAAAGPNFALVRMQSCRDIFSGALLTGDSMFQDHLAESYKHAMINIDTRLD